jgi:hypothetical protein
MGLPVDLCTLETSLMARPRRVDAWTCARDALAGQSAAQIANSGTYDKIECRYVRRWRPGMSQ